MVAMFIDNYRLPSRHKEQKETIAIFKLNNTLVQRKLAIVDVMNI